MKFNADEMMARYSTENIRYPVKIYEVFPFHQRQIWRDGENYVALNIETDKDDNVIESYLDELDVVYPTGYKRADINPAYYFTKSLKPEIAEQVTSNFDKYNYFTEEFAEAFLRGDYGKPISNPVIEIKYKREPYEEFMYAMTCVYKIEDRLFKLIFFADSLEAIEQGCCYFYFTESCEVTR